VHFRAAWGRMDRPSATDLGFVVDELAAEMADLKKRGAVFEEYDLPSLSLSQM